MENNDEKIEDRELGFFNNNDDKNYIGDEQFVACATEYILAMVYYNGVIQRDRIKKTFKKRTKIFEKIKLLCKIERGNLIIDNVIIESIKNVFLK